MTALALRVFWVSLTTSLVLLPLLLCARTIVCRYRAKSCYLLWLLLALRLLIPVEVPLPSAPVTVEVPAVVLEAPKQEQSANVSLSPVQTHPQPTLVEPSISAVEVAALVWVLGAAVVLCFQCECYYTASRRLLNGAQERGEDRLLLAQMGSTLPVLRADVDTPMTLGLRYPVILLPHQTEAEDLPMMLRHEICHVQRGDLWYKGLFLLCAALHWFNPLVWRLAWVAGETVELCCDEDVVSGQDAQFRRRYGQVLLHSAAVRTGVALSTSFGSGDLKGRLMNLFVTKKKGTALVCVAACAALTMGSLVGCEAAAAATPDPDQSVAPASSTVQMYSKTLADSVVWSADGSSLSFVLPELEQGKSWNVQIFGRFVAQDGMSMSVHLEVPEESRNGGSYTVPVSPRSEVGATEGNYSELNLYAYLKNGETVEEEVTVDLLSLQGEAVEQTEETAWVWPVEGHYTLSAFYQKDRIHPITGEHNNHNGVDIPAQNGTGVIAAADGVVLLAEFDKQYGNYVILDHGNGLSTLYAHMVKPLVEVGAEVTAGQFIGSVGQTGQATGPHLHFEIRESEVPTDPLYYYPGMGLEMTDGSMAVLSPD